MRGRRLTSWPSLWTDLRRAGAEVLDQSPSAARQGYAEFDQGAPKKFILDPPQGIIGA